VIGLPVITYWECHLHPERGKTCDRSICFSEIRLLVSFYYKTSRVSRCLGSINFCLEYPHESNHLVLNQRFAINIIPRMILAQRGEFSLHSLLPFGIDNSILVTSQIFNPDQTWLQL
jgi:hypothetical protein